MPPSSMKRATALLQLAGELDMALQPVRRNRLEHLRTEAVGRRWPRTHTFSATGAPVQGGQPEALHLASGAHEGCLRAVSTALRVSSLSYLALNTCLSTSCRCLSSTHFARFRGRSVGNLSGESGQE